MSSSSWNLGVREVSGLALRRDPRSGVDEVIAISDRTTTIVRLGTDGAGRLSADEPGHRGARHQRVHGLPDDLDRPDGGSQWEGVAGDAAGRMVVLCERSSELLVLSPGFEFERRIALHHPWRRDGNTGLEALLLLRDGHVLAAKQRDPRRLLEFGPSGDRPLGLTASSPLPPGEPAELSSATELDCLATWRLADHTLDGVNDISAGAGGLYLISSASRKYAKVRLPVSGEVRLERWWRLPRGVAAGGDAKAEGLLVDERIGVLVAVDTHDDRDNLYRIGPVPADSSGRP